MHLSTRLTIAMISVALLTALAVSQLGLIGATIATLCAGLLGVLIARRLLEQHKQIERLVSANPDAVLVVDAENVVRFANGAALMLFGKSEADFVDKPLPYAIREDTACDISFTRNGKECSAEMRATPFEWNNEQAHLASIRETTEQKQLAEQFMQSQKMEALGLLASGVAHDFNNLLTVIVNCATFLSEAISEGDPRKHDVRQILGASERAEGLVSQLLALTRKKSTQPRTIDLKETIQSLQGLLRRTLSTNIDIVMEIQNAWPIFADKGQMDQVLMNLAVNAKDAMAMGGRLTITLENLAAQSATKTHAAGDYVRLRVTDTGEGIAPEILPRVFDPFFTTKAPGKGTGLGLATCYAIAHQAGGSIGIESELGRGTTMTLLLPRAQDTSIGEPEEIADLPEQLRGNETILIAEDDITVREMISGLLRRHGYQVLVAANGEEALHLIEAKNGAIDIVLSDIVMPRMNGRELAKSLQTTRPDFKLLLMSAHAEGDPHEPAGVPPRVIIAKPFRPNALLRRLRETLDASAGEKTAEC